MNYSTIKLITAPKVMLIVALLVLIAGMTAIHYFIEYERNRDLIVWQNKLSYATHREKKAIDSYLNEKIQGLLNISNNTTVKLYLSDIINPQESQEKTTSRSSRNYKRYLRELIIIKASELGFYSTHSQEFSTKQISSLKNSLMIVDENAKTIISGNTANALPENIQQGIKANSYIKPYQLIQLIQKDNHQLRIAFVMPIYPPQMNSNTYGAKATAYLVAIKDIAPSIKQQLHNHIAAETNQDISLIRQDGAQLLYLLSLSNKLPSSKRQLNADTLELASATVMKKPEQFHQKIDHSGRDVLIFGSMLNELPWAIMHSMDKEFALSESKTHATFLYITFLSILIALMLVFIILWRRTQSHDKQKQIQELQLINQTLVQQNELFQLISDNSPNYGMLLDKHQNIVYGNKVLSNLFGIPSSALIGQYLPELLEKSSAKHLAPLLSGQGPKNQLVTIGNDDGKTLHTRYTKLNDENEDYTMLVATDISSTIEEEKQKEQTMQQVVVMFTKMLEQHDPYSAEHSSRVKKIATLLGHSFNYNVDQIFNLTLAASLINIGKFYIPTEILLKESPLTDEEHKIIQGHILHAIRLLNDIELNNEITQAITQSHERLDGTGFPHQLKGAEIQPFARILAVTNAFIAMIYPRPWRYAMQQTEALDILMKSSGYDKKIIMSLYNIVETEGDIKL